MTFITRQAGLPPHGHAATSARPFEHDLPVLAKEQNPMTPIDWEPLLAAGVQPSLMLGAERRWKGAR